MKQREKLLLYVFSVMFAVIVGGGLLTLSVKKYGSISAENTRLRARLVDMTASIAQGEDWKSRSEWVEDNIPAFGSKQEASARLLEVVQKEAQKAGVTLAGKEFLEEARQMESLDDGDEKTGYYDKATVKITVSGVKEKELYAWMHALQQPKTFLGITRLQIVPSGQGKTVNCELDVTQFYRESQAPKLTKVD